MKPIRNSAKAIIIQGDKMLFTKNKDHMGFFYLLPGGGQEHCESLVDALKRECREEILAEVNVGDIKFIREYIGKNHEFAEWDGELHQMEYMFECTLENPAEVGNGTVPDDMQVGIEWIELSRLSEFRIYPKVLTEVIHRDGSFENLVYLGDIN